MDVPVEMVEMVEAVGTSQARAVTVVTGMAGPIDSAKQRSADASHAGMATNGLTWT